MNLPEDFDEFWDATTEEANAAKLDYYRSLKNEFDLPGFTVETLDFRGIKGNRLKGWIAYPEGARRNPAFLWVPPYGRESKLPDAYGTRAGFTSLSFNFHGEEAFHQEKYMTQRGYFAEGAGDPETWVFRTMFQNAVIASRVLQAQLEADENRIAAVGMSQGAGISIWLGAFCRVIRAVAADMPFLGNIATTLTGSVYRYPLKELGDFMGTIPLGQERVLNTVNYFDTAYVATRCEVPTHVSLGLKDPACRPDTVRAIYEALPGIKTLTEYDWGHDWHPDMVENNREWLRHHLG
ncbi:MAG: acetylxylan esterase [Fimbriimonas sp.]